MIYICGFQAISWISKLRAQQQIRSLLRTVHTHKPRQQMTKLQAFKDSSPMHMTLATRGCLFKIHLETTITGYISRTLIWMIMGDSHDLVPLHYFLTGYISRTLNHLEGTILS